VIRFEELLHNKYTKKTTRRTVFLRPEAVVMIVDDPQMTSTLRNEGAGVSAVCRLLIDAVTSRREIYVAGTAADIRNKMPSCSTAPAAKELLNG